MAKLRWVSSFRIQRRFDGSGGGRGKHRRFRSHIMHNGSVHFTVEPSRQVTQITRAREWCCSKDVEPPGGFRPGHQACPNLPFAAIRCNLSGEPAAPRRGRSHPPPLQSSGGVPSIRPPPLRTKPPVRAHDRMDAPLPRPSPPGWRCAPCLLACSYSLLRPAGGSRPKRCCVRVCLSVCLVPCQSVCLPACLPAGLSVRVHICACARVRA